MKKYLAIATLFVFCAGSAWASLGDLIEVGRSQKEIAEALADETETFNKVNRAVQSNSIAKGRTKEDIIKEYGEPVIKLKKENNNPDMIVYKPADATFFDGPKIYFIFDDSGKLTDIKVVEKKAKPGVGQEGKK